jgi:hypoxanthine phosphoribosyltransferase
MPTVTSGSVKMSSDVTMDLAGRRVLIVDDIRDTGRTLMFGRNRIAAHNPRQLLSAVLLDKPSSREVAMQADFVGFSIDDVFVAGYGIDYSEKHRDLPDIIRVN